MPQMTDVGRIGRDAELRYTPNGDAVINLAVACDYGRKGQDGKKPTQWVDLTIWGKQAEALAQYLVKGQQIYFLADDIHIDTYQRNGGGEGSKLMGRIVTLKLVGSAPQAGSSQPRQQPRQQQAPGPDSFDDDIPF